MFHDLHIIFFLWDSGSQIPKVIAESVLEVLEKLFLLSCLKLLLFSVLKGMH